MEIDLQVLKDGSVVVLHDSTLLRTAVEGDGSWLPWLLSFIDGGRTRLTAPVGQLNLDEVRAVAVGDSTHQERVPTFAEVLQLLLVPPPVTGSLGGGKQERVVHMLAEIKSEGMSHSSGFDSRLTAGAAAAVLEAGVPPSALTWISFSLSALLDVKKHTPDHQTLLIQYVMTSHQAWTVARLAVDSGVDGIDLNADPSVVSKELVDWLHARGKRVAVWVWRAPAANDNAHVWAHMEHVGVDLFTSNLPPSLHEWITS